jgi:hypothetical protein
MSISKNLSLFEGKEKGGIERNYIIVFLDLRKITIIGKK